MRKAKELHWGFLILIILMVVAGCAKEKNSGTQLLEVSGLTVQAAEKTWVEEQLELSGTIKAQSVSAVSAKVMGVVKEIHVKAGDRVAAGQLLMVLENEDLQRRLYGAEAAYQESLRALTSAAANKDLQDVTRQRYEHLYQEKAISLQQLDQVQAQQKMASAEYERASAAAERAQFQMQEAKINRDYSQVVSPTAGVVAERRIELGSMALPGVPLLQVEDDRNFQVEAVLDEAWLGKVNIGQPVTVTVDSLGKSLPGSIEEIVPSIQVQGRGFLAKISVAAPGLRTGMYGKVKIPAGRKEAIVLPKNAIVEKGQLTGVYIIDDSQKIFYRLVRIGKSYGDKAEILSGLSGGELIVVQGTEKAADGAKAVGVVRP